MDFNPSKIKLIIGLGNPGSQYRLTYHNVGRLFIEYLQASNCRIQALESEVFMNDSGQFVKRALKQKGLKPEAVIIAHDDGDIMLGRWKIAFGRGAAGHKGIESIIGHLKSKNFWRLRIGVRPKTNPPSQISPNLARRGSLRRVKTGEFVLKNIAPGHREILRAAFHDAVTELNEKKRSEQTPRLNQKPTI